MDIKNRGKKIAFITVTTIAIGAMIFFAQLDIKEFENSIGAKTGEPLLTLAEPDDPYSGYSIDDILNSTAPPHITNIENDDIGAPVKINAHGLFLALELLILLFICAGIIFFKIQKRKIKSEKIVRSPGELSSMYQLSTISREISSAMNGIIDLCQILLETDLAQNQYDHAMTILNSAQALVTMINEIYTFSEIETGRLHLEAKKFDIRATIEDIAKIEALTAYEKGLELATLIHSNIPTQLHGDPNSLRQVIMNLLNNAVKFTQQGEVILSAELDKEKDTHATIRITVTDTGIGISKVLLDKLLKPLSQSDITTSQNSKGTGLGLARSKLLIKLLGGEIGIESEEGKGSTFWFTVVLEKQKQPDIAEILPSNNLSNLRVLIVDDNETTRNILCYYLNSWGCISKQAADGKEALQILRSSANTEKAFQIALLDSKTLEIDGWQLAQKIKADNALSTTKLILLSPDSLREKATKMDQAGIYCSIKKPVRQGQLLDCIKAVLDIKQMPARNKETAWQTQQMIYNDKYLRNLRMN